MVKSVIFTGSPVPTSCLHMLAWTLRFTSPVISRLRKPGCLNVDPRSSDMHLLMQYIMLLKTTLPSRHTMMQKMAEGRTHYNALGHCAGKLVRVIYKMLTDDVVFNLD